MLTSLSRIQDEEPTRYNNASQRTIQLMEYELELLIRINIKLQFDYNKLLEELGEDNYQRIFFEKKGRAFMKLEKGPGSFVPHNPKYFKKSKFSLFSLSFYPIITRRDFKCF